MQVDVDACIEYPSGKTYFITPDLDPNNYYEKKMDQATASDVYGVDQFFYYSEFCKFLLDLKNSQGLNKVLRYKGIDRYSNSWGNFYNEDIVAMLLDFLDDDTLYPIINNMRCLKGEKELNLMREAVKISCDAHVECMKLARPYYFEYQIAGYFQMMFGR